MPPTSSCINPRWRPFTNKRTLTHSWLVHGGGEERTSQYWAQIERKENHMLYTIAVVLLVLWALGLVTSYTMGGFIHLLLAVAVIMILVNIIQGRRPV